MKHLTLFEEYNGGEVETNWVEVIQWLRNSYYNKIDFVKEGITEFEDRIDGVFNKHAYNDQNTSLSHLQFGIASDSSTQCLFMDECELIKSNNQNNEEIEKVIKSTHGEKGFLKLVERMKIGRGGYELKKGYYPYYKFEGSFQLDKDVFLEVSRNESRYQSWCNKLLKDIFPDWNTYCQIQPMVNSAKFWIHLTDTTWSPE
jgi:hypothetical protein